MEEMVESYNLPQTKNFLKSINGHKFECFYKMIFTYRLSRFEILNVEWKDIDFDNDTITIYPVSYIMKGKRKSFTNVKKVPELSRTYPLLPHIKELLIREKQNQLNNLFHNKHYNNENVEYVCLKNNGERLNANTLSRNLKYIARDNDLPEILISGIKESAKEFFVKHISQNDYLWCWLRVDINKRRENAYGNFSLLKNKRFTNALDNLIDRTELKNEITLWGVLWQR